ncbi:hypothetical protein [Halorarius halobius]|uniref:hypothetical protein n=1 Tax=Halorarius halobius TaxID=2962671 RepID=UPI0020CDDA47|nr:hypothetical protein [Halorarius halobius]
MARQPRRVFAVVAVLLVAVLASYLLPVDLLTSGLLVVAALLVGGVGLVPGAWPTLYRTTGIGPGAWLLALAVAAGGVGLTYLVGDPQPFCDGIGYRGCLTLYGWASALYLAGSLAVAICFGHLGRYRRVRAAEVGPADDASDGPVAVTGRVVPADGTVTGPVSGAETVWYRHAAERSFLGGRLEAESETAGGPFYVADGSGRLLVDPAGIDAHDAAELARSHTDADGDAHHREWSFEPDDAVTVVGEASEVSRADYPEPVVAGVDGPVTVGRGDHAALRRWTAQRVLVGGALALLVGGGSLMVMLVAVL